MTDQPAIQSRGEDFAAAARILGESRHAISLTGAGLSVESGIPPFRGPGGIWTIHGEPPMDGYQRFLRDRCELCPVLFVERAEDQTAPSMRDRTDRGGPPRSPHQITQ